ncbi:MAG: hypothetical protein P8J45_12980 [Phycisphaerales bacterium]|nr:hypothetical protein [Phycisphaerales bacterium]
MSNETIQHLELKRLAVEWLRRLGCSAVATEVRCPISRWRVDVAGWFDGVDSAADRRRQGRLAEASPLFSSHDVERGADRARTIIIECKQARSDFLRDDADRDELLRARTHLESRRSEIEEQRVKPREPHLRRGGTALFPEMETWDFAASRIDSYRRVLRELRQIDKRLHGETKFGLLPQYHLADHLYLFTPSGLIRKPELPRGWGLLEASGMRLRHPMPIEDDAPLPMRERFAAPALDAPVDRRVRLLRNIAVAASRPPAGRPEAVSERRST